MVKTLSFYCRELRFNLWLGNKDSTGYKTWPKKIFFNFFGKKKRIITGDVILMELL